MLVGVGISGGVDSAVAASFLQSQGHEVMGFTMLLVDGMEAGVEKAAAVARRLGIEHRVLDFRREFSKCVLEDFIGEYLRGRTPSPCVGCNRKIKFGVMLDGMLAAGCDGIATGHYARVRLEEGEYALYRGRDRRKDQSYFLSGLSQRQLSKVIFPLGDKEKGAIKEVGDALGLVSKTEGESQDLCFLPEGDFASFILAHHPEMECAGTIVDQATGKVLGRHRGAFQYTIGQRRGLGLSGGPWFVLRTDVKANVVYVGRSEDLRCRRAMLEKVNFLVNFDGELEVTAQMRYLMRPVPALLRKTEDGGAVLEFPEGAALVPAGQVAVAYIGDRVVAGGIIMEVI